VTTPATETPCARGCGRPAKPAGSRGFRSALCESCTGDKRREQTRARVRRHRAKRKRDKTGGVYFGLPDVDPWDEARDARLYAGPWPVVAHPPCSRWCQYAGLVQARYGYRKGDDGGTFEAALGAVRTWGGVLEHPAFSALSRRVD
jgi:hypothetical protein